MSPDGWALTPPGPVGLPHPAGREQARQLGRQLANLNVDLAVVTRFVRTRETVDCALNGSDVPLLVEPDLDEIRAGVLDGQPISVYSAWKDEHPHGERFPQGESLDDAARRYADALRRLLGRSEAVTLVVGHELAILIHRRHRGRRGRPRCLRDEDRKRHALFLQRGGAAESGGAARRVRLPGVAWRNRTEAD